MQRRDFFYELPSDLIAQHPTAERVESRLLTLDGDSGRLADRLFTQLPQLLNPGDLLVFNDTRVIPARLFGQKDSGGKIEVLIERITGEFTALAHIRASKSPKPGTILRLESTLAATVTDRQEDLFALDFSANSQPLLTLLDAHGHMPLPPYIERADANADRERYQTVYARHPGAVAAPTAGLHFDREMLETLAEKGIRSAFVTLHVGAGTFQPMRVDDVTQHRMHTEYLDVSESVCASIRRTKELGGRIVAVGTTAVRALETAAKDGTIKPFAGDTDIFIYPGYRFNVVDAMVTNFHLPESTLIMLVCAFAGYANVMAAYRHAVEQRYRFFSYGDAMFITRRPLV